MVLRFNNVFCYQYTIDKSGGKDIVNVLLYYCAFLSMLLGRTLLQDKKSTLFIKVIDWSETILNSCNSNLISALSDMDQTGLRKVASKNNIQATSIGIQLTLSEFDYAKYKNNFRIKTLSFRALPYFSKFLSNKPKIWLVKPDETLFVDYYVYYCFVGERKRAIIRPIVSISGYRLVTSNRLR